MVVISGLCAMSAAFPVCPLRYGPSLRRTALPGLLPPLRRARPVSVRADITKTGASLAASVRQALQDGDGWPYCGTQGQIQLSESLKFCDGLQEFVGPERYQECAAAWRRQLLDEVPDAAVSIVNVAQLEPGTVTVRYNISWTPPNAGWLEGLGDAVPGWRVVKVDLLHKLRERTIFKWRNVYDLFRRALRTGDLLVPLAVIQCTATLTFSSTPRDGPLVLTQHRETFDLLQSVYSGELQNRALARDLLLFLETR